MSLDMRDFVAGMAHMAENLGPGTPAAAPDADTASLERLTAVISGDGSTTTELRGDPSATAREL